MHFSRLLIQGLLESFYIYPLARNVPIIASAWPPGFPNSAISEERSVIASILRVGYLAHMPTPFRFQELGSSYHTSTRDLNRSGVNSAARLPRSPKKSKLGVGPVVNSDLLRQFLLQNDTARERAREQYPAQASVDLPGITSSPCQSGLRFAYRLRRSPTPSRS